MEQLKDANAALGIVSLNGTTKLLMALVSAQSGGSKMGWNEARDS
jgi:hypothetical protein